jgi:hypothetical protein
MFWDDKKESAVLDLLLKADLISQDQRDEAIKLAGIKHLHIGQMLIMAGYVSPRDLQAAIDAVSMLRDNRINVFQAQDCLKKACKTRRTFVDVVREQIPGSET